jgi:hypothetical protein
MPKAEGDGIMKEEMSERVTPVNFQNRKTKSHYRVDGTTVIIKEKKSIFFALTVGNLTTFSYPGFVNHRSFSTLNSRSFCSQPHILHDGIQHANSETPIRHSNQSEI